MRLTFAELTPADRSSERCTRPLHAAQVIPVTGMVHDTAGARVSAISGASRLGDDGASYHAHAAGELVAPFGRGEAHASGPMRRQEGADAEVGQHHLLRAAARLVPV